MQGGIPSPCGWVGAGLVSQFHREGKGAGAIERKLLLFERGHERFSSVPLTQSGLDVPVALQGPRGDAGFGRGVTWKEPGSDDMAEQSVSTPCSARLKSDLIIEATLSLAFLLHSAEGPVLHTAWELSLNPGWLHFMPQVQLRGHSLSPPCCMCLLQPITPSPPPALFPAEPRDSFNVSDLETAASSHAGT